MNNLVQEKEEFKKLSKEDKLYRIRHTFAHVMAASVIRIFPDAKVAIGPPINNGFYYDFDLPRALTESDLAQIEDNMRDLLTADEYPLIKEVLSREDALKRFSDQPYKVELINDLPANEEISIYTVEKFIDLCRGPHVPTTRYLDPKGFKLLSIAGAYWRGDEKRPMLQRIYATAWPSAKELRTHLSWLEEVEKRDHRKLGKELDLFSTHEAAGSGLVYWHPKGARVRLAIEDYWRDIHLKNEYELLYTPHIGKSWLWETSGHLDFYKEGMFSPMELDSSDYYAKPMNCPFHIMIYQTSLRSYRELPLRWGELGTVYRYERSGVLHGLLRVRGFTQDDAHIFCTPEQTEDEIIEVLRFSMQVWNDFGFSDVKAYVATKPEKAVGKDEDWERTTAALRSAAEKEGLAYEMDEGGGAFYGPKIDLKIKDALGREWQMTTVQFDFNLPERFNIHFIDKDGEKKRPYMVHRALLGSMERFFGVLTEHYVGAFPVWLAPVQVELIGVHESYIPYMEEICSELKELGIRAVVNKDDERLGATIRKAQLQKIPYMLVFGEKEVQEHKITCRLRTGGEQKEFASKEAFIHFIQEKIRNKEVI